MRRSAKILILIQERIIKKKKSYERRDYESVDEMSLFYAMSRKNCEKKSGSKGLTVPNNELKWLLFYPVNWTNAFLGRERHLHLVQQ